MKKHSTDVQRESPILSSNVLFSKSLTRISTRTCQLPSAWQIGPIRIKAKFEQGEDVFRSAVAFRRMVTRLGPAAKMPFPIHPHMLRHSTGFKLANQGVDTRSLQHYLGHKNIQHTVRYSELSPDRFRDFWKD
jgi:integrase